MEIMDVFDEELQAKKAKKTLEANEGLNEFMEYLIGLIGSDESRFSFYSGFNNTVQIHDKKLNVVYQLDAKAIPFIVDANGNYVNL